MGLILMFTGPANGEVMVETLVQYKEHGVKELTDSTFEHLTQVNEILKSKALDTFECPRILRKKIMWIRANF